MLAAVASYGAGYQPPSCEKLRSSLLVDAVGHIDKELIKLEVNVEQYGSTITSDGWTDARSRPILNTLQVFANGAKFVDSIDTSGNTKVRVCYLSEFSSQDQSSESHAWCRTLLTLQRR